MVVKSDFMCLSVVFCQSTHAKPLTFRLIQCLDCHLMSPIVANTIRLLKFSMLLLYSPSLKSIALCHKNKQPNPIIKLMPHKKSRVPKKLRDTAVFYCQSTLCSLAYLAALSLSSAPMTSRTCWRLVSRRAFSSSLRLSSMTFSIPFLPRTTGTPR